MSVEIDNFLLKEMQTETTVELTDSFHEMDYLSIDVLIDDVRENGVYNKENDLFGLHENQSEEDDDFEMDSETALRKAIDDQFKETFQ